MNTLNEKTENQSYSYGCIMGYFYSPISNIEVDEEDIYNNEENEYGREIEPHVTLLYGLLDEQIDEDEIVNLLLMINCPKVSSKIVSTFDNDKYDVLKFDIEKGNLDILNKVITSSYPFETDYPDYHAHSTIAYCKKGTGKKYSQILLHEEIKQIAYWVYSKADGKKIKIDPFNKSIEILREANSEEETIVDESLLNIELTDIVEKYYGFQVQAIKMTKDMYRFSVFTENNKYETAIKGMMDYNNGLIICRNYINSIKKV